MPECHDGWEIMEMDNSYVFVPLEILVKILILDVFKNMMAYIMLFVIYVSYGPKNDKYSLGFVLHIHIWVMLLFE